MRKAGQTSKKTQATKKAGFFRNAMRKERGQARKGAGWMPWHWEPKKDAVSCEKLRGGANIL